MKNEDFNTKVVKYFKVYPAYIKDTRKQFKRIRKGFIKFLAYEGEFDNVLDKKEIKRAKKKGTLPEYLDVHHILPLSGGGTNDFSNLVVISKSTHKFINKNFFSVQLSSHLNDPFGSIYQIEIPAFNSHVDSERIIEYKKELAASILSRRKFEERI